MAHRCPALYRCNALCRILVVASGTLVVSKVMPQRVYSASRCVILWTILLAAAVVVSLLGVTVQE